MAVTVVPTLAFMADVYRLSADGGARSPRFAAYAASAARHLPVHGYNPMTRTPVLATVEALLAIDAETAAVAQTVPGWPTPLRSPTPPRSPTPVGGATLDLAAASWCTIAA